MASVLRRIAYWLRSRRQAAALQEELEFHQAMTARELEHGGMTPDQARLAARRQMGNATRAREDARAVWIWPWLDSVRQDVAYAGRSLTRQPGFTITSLGVLGVAIGLNASLFTVVAGLVIRPMAGMTDPARVVTVSSVNPPRVGGVSGLSFPEYAFLVSEARTLSGLAASHPMSVRLEAASVGRSTTAYLVTANYFDILGVGMERGRGFRPGEDRRGSGQAVAVLGYALWQTRFGGDPGVVGRQVPINGMPFTVVGIASQSFVGPAGSAQRVWLPISMLPLLRPGDPFATGMLDRAEDCCVSVTARVSPAVTSSDAQAELEVLSRRFRASVGQDERRLVLGGTQFLSGRRARDTALAIVGILFLGVVLVLLIACANVGNLLLARAAARVGEIGVRLSLGAGRPRLVRQLLTEGLVLAFVASGIGILVSMWLPPIALRMLAGESRPFDLSLDRWVLLDALGLAAISCLAFALAPALHATKFDITAALKSDARVLRSWFPLRSGLLAVQVAVSVVLLASAGLLLRGVAQARLLDPGFRVDGVAIATLDLPQGAYDQTRARALLDELTSELRRARHARFAFVSNEPLGDTSSYTAMRLRGESEQDTRSIKFLNISPGYFATLGIPLVAGRDFVDDDRGRSAVIVNQTMARRSWPDGNAVGQSFYAGGSRSLVEIVGVAADAHVSSMERIDPLLFLPPAENPLIAGDFPRLLFTTDDPSTASAVAAAIERLDANARAEITPLRDRVEDWLGDLRLAPLAASILGIFALGVATVGMVGVFSYVVRQRTREIGIRMALGAGTREVIRLVLGSSSKAVLVGLGVGGVGAIAASLALRSALYGLSPLDPIAYGGVMLLLAVAACLASYIPARRAMRIDPVRALRYE